MQNPQNSTLMQILKDLESLYPNKSDQVKDLIKGLSSKDIIAVDNKYAAHRYPERSITFTQVKNYDSNIARQELDVYASSILSLMERIASQDGYVSLSITAIQKELGIKSHHTIRQALDTLINRNLIALYRRPKRHESAIYMINPDSSNAGKPPSDADKNDFRQLVIMDYKLPIPKQQAAKVTIISDQGDRKITYGTLIPFAPNIQDEQKSSPEVAATTPGTGNDNKIVSSLAIENAINDDELPF